MDPLGYSWLADALVEPERFAQRPAVLERMEPPGRHECRWRNVFGRDRFHPDLARPPVDRKSTRLNSSHTVISYAVFCLKKKKKIKIKNLEPSKRSTIKRPKSTT